ncbi:MAG: response regulator [Bacteroidales bacterium]|nr:response regulator [Bacteroidales bacterium]
MKKSIKEIRVLIVDDNAINRQVLQFAMMKYKSKVETADNGVIAVELFMEKPFDLVFMDIMMPIMDGLAATKSIRKFEKEFLDTRSHIIAVSANFQDEDLEEYLSSGLDKVIKKPVDFKMLNNWLSELYEL